MVEPLRLSATFDESKATAGIKRLEKTMESVRRMPGMDAAVKWSGEFTEKMGDLVSSAGGVAGIFERMGVGGLAAGASLGALVAQMKNIGDGALKLKELAREVGMTVDQLNRFEQAGGKFGVTTEAMAGLVESLAAQMPQFRAGFGHLSDEIHSKLPNLTRILKTEDTQHQLETIFETLGKIKDPQQQKQVAELFFPGHGQDALQALSQGYETFRKNLEAMNSKVPAINPDIANQAQKLREATDEFNKSLTRFENDAAPKFLDSMTKMLTMADKLIVDIGKVTAVTKGWDESPKIKELHKREAESAATIIGKIWDYLTFGDLARKVSPPTGADGGGGKSDGGNDGSVHKSSYSGDGRGSLIEKASFNTGGTIHPAAYMVGSGLDPVGIVKEGVLEAFRAYALEKDSLDRAGGQGGGGVGVQNASYGGGGSGGGGGEPPTGVGGRPFRGRAAVGNWWNSEHVSHAVDRLMKEAHLSREGAEGLVSRWASVEAASGPTARNPKSGAYGIEQDIGPRKRGFTADFDSQIDHAIRQLNGTDPYNNEPRAARALRAARNAHEAAVGASMYERAEHYNAHAGTDDWTSKSEAAARRIHELATAQQQQKKQAAGRVTGSMSAAEADASNKARHAKPGNPDYIPPVPEIKPLPGQKGYESPHGKGSELQAHELHIFTHDHAGLIRTARLSTGGGMKITHTLRTAPLPDDMRNLG